MTQKCPTLYGSRSFTTWAVIIVRFKKSSSSGVKWELDSAKARPRMLMLHYANEKVGKKYQKPLLCLTEKLVIKADSHWLVSDDAVW